MKIVEKLILIGCLLGLLFLAYVNNPKPFQKLEQFITQKSIEPTEQQLIFSEHKRKWLNENR